MGNIYEKPKMNQSRYTVLIDGNNIKSVTHDPGQETYYQTKAEVYP